MVDALFGSIPRHDRRHVPPSAASRRCAFEQLEPRQLLAADALAEPPMLSTGTTGGATGMISGNVYVSPQADCEDHQLDAALASARVQLLDELGNVVEETITAADGSYVFADLLPGEYAVRQLTPQGLLEGASVIGTGGGIAFGASVVGEIFVQPGLTLEGYNFCSFESKPEVSGPTDRPIVPHEQIQAVPPFQIPQVAAANLAGLGVQEPSATATPIAESYVAANPVAAPRPADVFGGSSARLNERDEIRTWDDYLLDDLFARASLLELTSDGYASEAEFDALLVEMLDADDVTLVDGYTVNSTEWCDDVPCLDAEEFLQVAEILSSPDEPSTSESPQVAKVAGRDRSNQAR